MTLNFKERSQQAEIMDEAGLSFAEFDDCLIELETINRLTFAYRPTLAWLRGFQQAALRDLTILDVGCGRGDMLRTIVRHLQLPPGNLTGIDLNPWSRQAAVAAAPDLPITYLTGDLFAYRPERRPDVIISSLFTHHLPDAQLIAFLRWMDRQATRGWFINDLHRYWLPYWFIRIATRLCSRNRLIRHDAAVSVSRAFTRRDWQKLVQAAGLSGCKIRISWWFPFRYSVACRKS